MNRRDRFIAAAVSGMLASEATGEFYELDALTDRAIDIADELEERLEARSRHEETEERRLDRVWGAS